MSRRLSLAGLAVVATALSAAFGRSESASAEAEPVWTCPAAPVEILTDGDLAEWQSVPSFEIGETQLVRRAADWSGPRDLSGRIWIARSATALHVAGEIRDETLFWNPEVSFLGDGVELFFDFAPDPSARAADSYDANTHQLLLHPLAGEVRWTFARFRGREGRMDDPVDGVDLAGSRMQDEQGGTLGYRFELLLPLSNFPAAPVEPGASFGFDVALSDSDGLPQQESYATWSGRGDLSLFPSRFGRVTLGPNPSPVPKSDGGAPIRLLPFAFLISLFGLVLFAWLARGLDARTSRLAAVFERLAAIRARWLATLAGALIAAIVAALLVETVVVRVLLDRDLSRKRELAGLVRAIDDEAHALGLSRPQQPGAPAPIVSLLGGVALKRPTEYDTFLLPPPGPAPAASPAAASPAAEGAAAEPVPVPPEATHRTLQGVPFYRRDIPVTPAWSDAFVVSPPVDALEATVVYSWNRDPAQEAQPVLGAVAARVRFVRADGATDAPLELVWGRHLELPAAPGAPDVASPRTGAPEAAVAFVAAADQESAAATAPTAASGATGLAVRHALADSRSPVVRVEVEQGAPAGRFTLHGVTLVPRDGSAAVPLPLGRATRGGVPTAASPFPSDLAGLFLSKDRPRAVLPCDVRADKAWIIASLRHGYSDRRFGLPVLSVRAEFDDGSSDSPRVLENGLDLDAEATPARLHGEHFRSELAFQWGLPDEPRRHFDATTLAFERPGRKLARLHFEFKGEEETVRIASVVLGTLRASPTSVPTERLASTTDGWRVAPGVLAALAEVDVTAYRDGAAVATTAQGPSRDRMLARTMSPSLQAEVARAADARHDVRVVDSRPQHTLLFPLHGAFAEMSWTSTVDAQVTRLAYWLRLALGALLAPVAILLLARMVQRLHSLHARMVAAFAAVAAVPAALAYFAVPELISGGIEATEREGALEKLAAVKGRLASLRSEARQLASQGLRDEAFQEALRRRGADDFRSAMSAALRDVERNVVAPAAPGGRVALDVSPRSAPAERIVFPQDLRWTVFRDRESLLSDEFAWRWSRLIARGVAQQYDTSGEWSAKLVVELPVATAALRSAATAAGGDAQVLLWTPRGYPLATTGPASPGEETPEEMARKREILRRIVDDVQPALETRRIGGSAHTVAYDVIRDESGVACLIGVATARAGAEALLARVTGASLLVFGVGIAMQFLLVGIVSTRSTRPWTRLVERTRGAAETPPAEDVAEVGARFDALRAERDRLEAEMTAVAAAAQDPADAGDTDLVAARAMDILRERAAPWGAALLTPDSEGRMSILTGWRGSDPLPRTALAGDPAGPLAQAFRGRGSVRVSAVGAILDHVSRDERRLFEGASSLSAYPLTAADGRGGALLVLFRGSGRPVGDAFLAALARSTGLALEAARLYRLAVRDPETGSHVASWFRERLREEVDRAVSSKRSISLLLVGATAAPPDPASSRAAAQRIAAMMRSFAPGRAFLGRMEPLAFALAVPESDRAGAESLALEIRRAAAEPATASLRLRVGVASCPEDAGSSEFLIAESRRALAVDAGASPHASHAPADPGGRIAADARAQGYVFESAESRALLETIDRIAASGLTILVQGETGTGKEIVADLIHRRSPRAGGPFVKINCAALPEALLESELFGYDRGAFTGADRTKPGRFETADGGTLFLDEIGELSLATQAKLLRVIEDRTVEHLGGTRGIAVDVRIVAATNRDLASAVAEGRFREDLYYRLNAVTLAIPPLRARKQDIPALADAFLRAGSAAHGRRPPVLEPDAMDILFRHDWPGNVRELKNLMEQAAVLCQGDSLRAADLAPALAARGRIRAGAREHARPEGTSPSAPPPQPTRDAPADDSPAAVSDRQRRLLALLSEQEWITTSDYCERVGVSPRTALRDVRELLERGVLTMDGKRRGARYRLK